MVMMPGGQPGMMPMGMGHAAGARGAGSGCHHHSASFDAHGSGITRDGGCRSNVRGGLLQADNESYESALKMT